MITPMLDRLLKTIFLVALCIMTGCASSDTLRLYNSGFKAALLGPFDNRTAKPKDEVATLLVKKPPAFCDRIDGIDLIARQRLSKGSIGVNRLSKVEMLPGAHTVEIRYHQIISTNNRGSIEFRASIAPFVLSFDAEAGRVYRINAIERGEMNWAALIEDISESESKPILVAPKGGGIEFKTNLEDAMASKNIIADNISVAYPEGSKNTMPRQPSK